MKRLIVMRHGSYGSDGFLYEVAKDHIARVARALRETISNENRVLIYSSPTARTLQTAKIIGGVLGVEVNIHPELEPNDRAQEMRFWDEFTQKWKQFDVGVVVTHVEKAPWVACSLCQYVGMPTGYFENRVLLMGEAWDIDFEKQTAHTHTDAFNQ